MTPGSPSKPYASLPPNVRRMLMRRDAEIVAAKALRDRYQTNWISTSNQARDYMRERDRLAAEVKTLKQQLREALAAPTPIADPQPAQDNISSVVATAADAPYTPADVMCAPLYEWWKSWHFDDGPAWDVVEAPPSPPAQAPIRERMTVNYNTVIFDTNNRYVSDSEEQRLCVTPCWPFPDLSDHLAITGKAFNGDAMVFNDGPGVRVRRAGEHMPSPPWPEDGEMYPVDFPTIWRAAEILKGGMA